MNRSRLAVFVLTLLIAASSVQAKEFYELYDEGLKAVRDKNWRVVVEKMTAAIAAKPDENRRARTYGVNTVAYHPYYYRGVAYMNLEEYDKASKDLSRATGVGPENLGSVDNVITRVETRLALAAQTLVPGGGGQTAPPPPPPTVTQTAQVVPVPPPPTTTQQQVVPPPSRPDPAIAPARARAEEQIREASQKMAAARTAGADTRASADYRRGQQMLIDAQSKQVSASSVRDWNEVGSAADRASRQFDLAISRAQLQPVPTPTPTRPDPGPAEQLLEATRRRVRDALTDYFSGEYRRSAQGFEELASREQADNPMVWAFLGASHYSVYLLGGETDTGSRQAATEAFRKARQIKPDLQLSSRYFSPRIRSFYDATR